jgi:hypothetical protein
MQAGDLLNEYQQLQNILAIGSHTYSEASKKEVTNSGRTFQLFGDYYCLSLPFLLSSLVNPIFSVVSTQR